MDGTTRPVVVGTDGNHDAPLWFAVDEAQRRRAPLRVIHCAAMPFEQIEAYATKATFQEMLAAGHQVIDDARRALEKTAGVLDVEFVLSDRSPIELLVEESEAAQLLIVGIDDLPWYDRLLGMAVADHVVQHAHCAVIAVPEPQHDDARRAGVVVALDGNSAAQPLLRMAFDEARERGTSLHAFMVIADNTQPSVVESAGVALSETLAGWREECPEVELEQEVVAGPLNEACHTVTRSAALVLVGRRRSRGTGRSVVADLLRHAECAVCVVPLEERHA